MTRKRVMLLLFLANLTTLKASPPINYDSAVNAADHFISSTLPEKDRIYVFRDKLIISASILSYQEDVVRIFSISEIRKISDVWKVISLDPKQQWELSIYRSDNPMWPAFRMDGKEILASDHPLQARDVILVQPAPPPSSAPVFP